MKPEELTAHPDQVYQVVDEASATELLLALELLGTFEKGSLAEGRSMSAKVYDAHPTHWIAAFCFRGEQKAEGNGYGFLALPKKSYGLADAHFQIRRLGEAAGYRGMMR